MKREFTDNELNALLDFADSHAGTGAVTLLLHRDKYPDIDIEQAIQQIEGRRQASVKWPTLVSCRNFLFPPRLNREQSSSDLTAEYKRRLAESLAKGSIRIADLTGGMGIDTLHLAEIPGSHVDYSEQDEELCLIASHNFTALGKTNIDIHHGDSMEWLKQTDPCNTFDIIVIDPARRDGKGRKVAAFEDCTPNLLNNLELLKSCSRWMIVKASPMIDIDKGLSEFKETAEVHVVSVKGECKEVLFIVGGDNNRPKIVCTELNNSGIQSQFTFSREEEASATADYCDQIGRFIYEPDATIMKAGPYKLLSQQYGLRKLARNTHLYTSDEMISGWIGRVFEVEKPLKPRKKEILSAIPSMRAHVVTRNYPSEAAELQKSLGIKEGGDKFIIATTVGTKKMVFLCRACK